MQPDTDDRRAGGLEALRQQGADRTGQHIARAAGGQALVSGRIDPGAPFRVSDYGSVALGDDDGIGPVARPRGRQSSGR